MPSSEDERIRKGLKFLTKADSATIRATVILQRLEGVPHPQGTTTLLKRYSFHIGQKVYKGVMIKEQHDYLQGYTANPKQFADAIARILLIMNNKILTTLTDLSGALGVPKIGKAPVVAAKILAGTTPGCCVFDTDQQQAGVTQSFCEGGLVGTWTQGPCGKKPPTQE